MAAAAVRYCHNTRSRGGPLAMAFGPSTMMSPVRTTWRTGVEAHPARSRSAKPRLNPKLNLNPNRNLFSCQGLRLRAGLRLRLRLRGLTLALDSLARRAGLRANI